MSVVILESKTTHMMPNSRENLNSVVAMVLLFIISLLLFPRTSGAVLFLSQSKHLSIAFSFPTNRIPDIASNTVKNVVVSIAITSVTLYDPRIVSAASIERGEELFQQNCASCHRNGENVMNPQRDLKRETLLKYFGGDGKIVSIDQTLAWIEKSGQHKRLFFPNVPGGKLSSEDYENSISFIVDQANNDKW